MMGRNFAKSDLPALAAGLMVLAVASGCGSIGSADACAPFTSCDAVVDMVLDETFTGAELSSLCEQWNALTSGEQERLAEDFAGQADDLSQVEGMGLFEDPDAAATGIVASFLDDLDRRCS